MIPKKLFKIGEVMRYSELSRQTIHNYTMLGLITEEERTDSGHRLYDETVFAQLERIKKLRKSQTLKEIRVILDQERDHEGEKEIAPDVSRGGEHQGPALLQGSCGVAVQCQKWRGPGVISPGLSWQTRRGYARLAGELSMGLPDETVRLLPVDAGVGDGDPVLEYGGVVVQGLVALV